MKKKLHAFEVTHVTDSHWYDGYRAFMRGAPDTDNPFPHMSPGYFNWANGWFTARQDYIEQKSRSSNPARPENS